MVRFLSRIGVPRDQARKALFSILDSCQNRESTIQFSILLRQGEEKLLEQYGSADNYPKFVKKTLDTLRGKRRQS